MDLDLEAAQQSLATASRGEGRTGVLEMGESGPEELFDEVGVAVLVAVGERVAGRRFNSRLPRVPADEPSRNEVAPLLEDGNFGSCWRLLFIHPYRVAGDQGGGAARFSASIAFPWGTVLEERRAF